MRPKGIELVPGKSYSVARRNADPITAKFLRETPSFRWHKRKRWVFSDPKTGLELIVKAKSHITELA
jgi:hypothetical protein